MCCLFGRKDLGAGAIDGSRRKGAFKDLASDGIRDEEQCRCIGRWRSQAENEGRRRWGTNDHGCTGRRQQWSDTTGRAIVDDRRCCSRDGATRTWACRPGGARRPRFSLAIGTFSRSTRIPDARNGLQRRRGKCGVSADVDLWLGRDEDDADQEGTCQTQSKHPCPTSCFLRHRATHVRVVANV